MQTGNFLYNAEDVGNLVVGMQNGQPVYLRQIATVKDGAESPAQYVFFGYGSADTAVSKGFKGDYPAVTLSVAKRKGADAMKVAEHIEHKLEHLKKELLPDSVQLPHKKLWGDSFGKSIGTAAHLFVAIVAVTLFVMLAMGWRGGLVVSFCYRLLLPLPYFLITFSIIP